MDRNNRDVAVAYLRAQGVRPKAAIGRQRAACEAHAKLLGLTLRTVYADQGRTVAGREALGRLLRAAARGKFAVVLVEDMDRLARSLDDLSKVVGTLRGHGVEISQVGRDGTTFPDIRIEGMMGRELRRIMAERSRRGLHQAARRGLVPGRCCYGYGPVAGRPGERVIVPGQAAVVREAFELRRRGRSPNRIAEALNAREYADRTWTGRTVDRLLRNELYVGLLVYGRSARVRDVNTGLVRTVARPRPEWVVERVEHLAIVERSTWEAVQALRGTAAQVEPTPSAVAESDPPAR